MSFDNIVLYSYQRAFCIQFTTILFPCGHSRCDLICTTDPRSTTLMLIAIDEFVDWMFW
jgi:hypothetical protein